MNWQRLTVILIPETGRRTKRFQLPQIAVAAMVAMALGILVLVGTTLHINATLVLRIKELEPLQGITRQQRAEIDQMFVKATQMQAQLDHLHAVEANIRQITAANAELLTPQSRVIANQREPITLTGRGGGRTSSELEPSSPVFVLSTFMPNEVIQVAFSHRPQIEATTAPQVDQDKSFTQAKETIAKMASQLLASEDLRLRLTEHEKTVESHLEHLVNRPIGLPIIGGRLTDRFGWRYSPFGWGQQLHSGLDIAAPYWTVVNATAPGTVTQAGWKGGGFGYTITIDHAYGYQTMYAHLSDWDVKAGDRVERGQQIGWVGSTGASTGPHLHYEVHVDGVPVDPAKYLN